MSASKVQPILTAENVTMRFGGVTAVSDLSLKVDEGSIVGVIGPNGAGKTTLFNVLSGFYTPQEGDVRFAGKSIRGRKPFEICRMGMARTFQNIRL
ncbi:ATP-binding cassette domain-containing protein, partial [Desulfovibrio sp.]